MSSLQIQRGFWLQVLRKSSLRTGILTGLLLNVVMAAALIAANRMPWLESCALERNAVSEGVFFLVAMIPVFRFFRSPRQLLFSGVIAVAFLTMGYEVAAMYFAMLTHVLRTPVEVFIDGGIGYGVAAAGIWVLAMFQFLYGHTLVPTRRRHPGIHP
jgi:hypothetical protein